MPFVHQICQTPQQNSSQLYYILHSSFSQYLAGNAAQNCKPLKKPSAAILCLNVTANAYFCSCGHAVLNLTKIKAQKHKVATARLQVIKLCRLHVRGELCLLPAKVSLLGTLGVSCLILNVTPANQHQKHMVESAI